MLGFTDRIAANRYVRPPTRRSYTGDGLA